MAQDEGSLPSIESFERRFGDLAPERRESVTSSGAQSAHVSRKVAFVRSDSKRDQKRVRHLGQRHKRSEPVYTVGIDEVGEAVLAVNQNVLDTASMTEQNIKVLQKSLSELMGKGYSDLIHILSKVPNKNDAKKLLNELAALVSNDKQLSKKIDASAGELKIAVSQVDINTQAIAGSLKELPKEVSVLLLPVIESLAGQRVENAKWGKVIHDRLTELSEVIRSALGVENSNVRILEEQVRTLTDVNEELEVALSKANFSEFESGRITAQAKVIREMSDQLTAMQVRVEELLSQAEHDSDNFQERLQSQREVFSEDLRSSALAHRKAVSDLQTQIRVLKGKLAGSVENEHMLYERYARDTMRLENELGKSQLSEKRQRETAQRDFDAATSEASTKLSQLSEILAKVQAERDLYRSEAAELKEKAKEQVLYTNRKRVRGALELNRVMENMQRAVNDAVGPQNDYLKAKAEDARIRERGAALAREQEDSIRVRNEQVSALKVEMQNDLASIHKNLSPLGEVFERLSEFTSAQDFLDHVHVIESTARKRLSAHPPVLDKTIKYLERWRVEITRLQEKITDLESVPTS